LYLPSLWVQAAPADLPEHKPAAKSSKQLKAVDLKPLADSGGVKNTPGRQRESVSSDAVPAGNRAKTPDPEADAEDPAAESSKDADAGAAGGTGTGSDAGKEHEHAANPLDHIQPNVAPDFSSIDFSNLIELRESLHAQVDAEKQRLDGDAALAPEERSRRMEQLDLKVKEIEVLEGMVRRALEVYQNVLKTSKDHNTTASDVKSESEKVIYDLQLTALKAKAEMKAIAKDEQHREKEKEKAKDADAAAADAAAKLPAVGKEPDAKEPADAGAGSNKEPAFDDADADEDPVISAPGSKEPGASVDQTSTVNGTLATNGTAKGAQDIAQDIAKDILKEVSGTADKIEDNLLDSNAFAEGTKAKGATIETVLKVEDTEQQKFDEEHEDVSIPLFRPFAKGRGGIVSILIDAESNQYVLSRPNDVTYFYEDGGLFRFDRPIVSAVSSPCPHFSTPSQRCGPHFHVFLHRLFPLQSDRSSSVLWTFDSWRTARPQCLEHDQKLGADSHFGAARGRFHPFRSRS
jgi:hypothetical protein